MRRPLPAALLAVLVVVAGGLAACEPGSDESLTDPREILTRTLRAGSGLRTVTVHVELQVRDPDNPGAGVAGVDGGILEAQVDLVATEFTARGVSATGAEAFRVISADDSIFMNTGNGRWQQTPVDPGMLSNPTSLLFFGMGGGLGGDGPDFVGILGQAIREPSIPIHLVGVEDCSAGRCYHTAIDVPADALWPLAIQLSGLDRMPGFAPPAPALDQLPRISLAVLSDTRTLHPVEILIEGSLGRTTAQLRVQLADHDAPVAIQPPPPELVDPAVDFGFGGNVVRPAPMPVEPIPDQEAAPAP